MTDKYVYSCPYCGGCEMIEGYQDGYAAITSAESIWLGTKLVHVVCRNCGSVVRSYVKKPEKLLKRRHRR